MPPGGGRVSMAEVVEVEYSFALEYDGPPITHDLPRAVPINVESIPVAKVVAEVSQTEKLLLPVVHPISASDISRRFSKELSLASVTTVSPTSVIEFERRIGAGDECLLQKEPSSISVSPESGIGIEEGDSNICKLASADELGGSCSFTSQDDGIHSGDLLERTHCSAGFASSSMSREITNDPSCSLGSSSGALDFTNNFVKPKDLSGSSALQEFSNDHKDSIDSNDLSQPDWLSNESVLSIDYPSSRVSSQRVGDANSTDARRVPIVTFRDLELAEEDARDEFTRVKLETIREKREPEVKTRKGACYRCNKGNRFTEKEVCIVCDAKYCSSCVLRAMGSMPEGRKCITCIGNSIDEGKRANLGKCSRMLKRLLNDLEIRQVMKAERSCEVNQLLPEYIFVNNKPLCQEELVILQNSPNPPKKLKPGRYWYDKVSGLWGKDGEKPAKIISPHLNVGGLLRADASSGNTQVFINGREITKVELRMLQLAGVQCAGNPHFWVDADGSYQEEGQKNTRGYIWGKAGTKLICAVLSLPVPSKSANSYGEQVYSMTSRPASDYIDPRNIPKLLLIGSSGSGTSTIFKQAKILYKDVPFSEEERENIKVLIQSNVYGYLGILLEGRERFEDESLSQIRGRHSSTEHVAAGSTDDGDQKTVYSICPRLKTFSDWLLKTMVTGNLEVIFPAATREYAPLVEELWNNTAIQATYNRRSELEMLPSYANYFLERIVDILKPDYEPSDVDILYAEGVTLSNGLACVDFSFPQSAPDDDDIDSGDQHDFMLRYQLIRVQARSFGENCKWLEMLEDVRIVVFCIAIE
ncbi:extra-large guanine nucleotide-binding protein 1-like [Impatiens glandulifera]|uniref:extra-large guanine nucleotide-binding protein 1-like n=1 Tax=Impatiens glandulifera TaxID=253017 RepID=UPI001FB08489|nr:extra-large guanine nucleotide-binding protein 1-like [Impatiens glandulifera]